MRLSTNLFELDKTQRTFINLDVDMFLKLSSPLRTFKRIGSDIFVRNKKGKFIPIWRLVREFPYEGFTVEYKDGDNTNLERNNLLIKRKSKTL